jgi:hypothetical protein
MARCPSDLALEGFLLERERSQAAPHVGGCPSCQARIAKMEEEGKHFLQYVYPATVAKIEEAAASRHGSWRRWALLLPVPAAAALATVLLMSKGDRPADLLSGDGDQTQIKGGGPGSIGLTVFLGAAEGARVLGDGDSVPASAAIRFKVQPTKACSLWVVSVDAQGEVSRLYPASGETGAEMSRGGALPGGAVLDGRRGPERIFALCTQRPIAFGDVERAVRNAIGRDEGTVRAITNVPGLPDGTSQATVLIEKRL